MKALFRVIPVELERLGSAEIDQLQLLAHENDVVLLHAYRSLDGLSLTVGPGEDADTFRSRAEVFFRDTEKTIGKKSRTLRWRARLRRLNPLLVLLPAVGTGFAVLVTVNSGYLNSVMEVLTSLPVIGTLGASVTALSAYALTSASSRRVRAALDRAEGELQQLSTKEPDKEKAARAALILHSVTASRDLDGLRVASLRYQIGGVLALALGLTGPGAAWWILYWQVDPRYFIASAPLSLVPMAVGAALLRHDAKVRNHYRVVAAEISHLDRIQLALDYARADPEVTHVDAVRRRAIDQLLHPRPIVVVPEVAAPEEPLSFAGVVELASKAATKKPTEA